MLINYFLLSQSLQNYNLWNEDDSKNIESLVLEMKNEKKVDNAKLLLDVIPRSALGYEFSLDKVILILINWSSNINSTGFNICS